MKNRMSRVLSVPVLALLAAILTPVSANGGLIYSYSGPTYDFINNGTDLTLSDNVTALITFSTEPTANETGKSDVDTFSFTSGPVTITDSSPSLTTSFSFDFDGSLSIVDWMVGVQAEVFAAGDGLENIITIADQLDLTAIGDSAADVFAVGSFGAGDSTGQTSGVDVSEQQWTAVPEPSSLLLLGIACLTGIGRSSCRK